MKKIIILTLAVLIHYHSWAQLTLSQAECREMALKSNEEMQKAGNAYEQAKLDKAIAFTAYLPSFSGSLMGLYKPEGIDVMNYTLQMHGTYMAGIALSQPIYTGGKINAANKMAKTGVECSEESMRKTRMQVICDADKAYWTYVVVHEKINLLESYYRQLDTLYNQMQNNVRVEMATQNDMLRIEAKRSQIMYQLQKAKNGYDLCRLSLCNVIGVEPDTPITAADTVIQVTAPQPLSHDISKRPELKLLEKQIEIQQQQIKAARADFLPSLALVGQYYYFDNLKVKGFADNGAGGQVPFKSTFNDHGSIFMLTASIPLFHWGEGRKKVKRAQIELQNSHLDLQQNRSLLSIELQQAIKNLTDGYHLIQTAELGLRQAEENLRVMNNRYKVEMCTLTDLMDAQTLWQEARSNQIEACTQYKVYESEYLQAAGLL